MKKLTLSERFSKLEMEKLELEFELTIPEYVKEYLYKYVGLYITEKKYVNIHNKLFSFGEFIRYDVIHWLLLEFKEQGFSKVLPFASDEGTWPFCLSLEGKTKNQVLMYQLEIECKNEEDAFEFVADSFEEFINGLQTESSSIITKDLLHQEIRQFTLADRFFEYDFNKLYAKFGFVFTDSLKDYLKKYSGVEVVENTYTNKNGKKHLLSKFIDSGLIYRLSIELQKENLGVKIPFGLNCTNGTGWTLNSSGLVYCLSLDENTKNQVLSVPFEFVLDDKGKNAIFRLPIDKTLTNKEDAFEFVADSFEEFIDGLQAEQEFSVLLNIFT